MLICVLLLYPVTLLNSLILGIFLHIPQYFLQTILSVNRDGFISSFPIRMPLISLSHFIALARTSGMMLDRNGKSGHTCLVN